MMLGHGCGGAIARLVVVCWMLLGPVAAGANPGIWRTQHALNKDGRVVRDRLHTRNNSNNDDYSFLNAVGAVWPADIARSAAGYSASTGFLIDRCHVLTNLHVVFSGDPILHPSVGAAVAFGVGQTDGNGNRGALQGLRFLFRGAVIAHGDALIVDRYVHDPENDWALIRLAANVDDTITPMTIAAVDTGQLLGNPLISTAGFPSDHRVRRGDQFELKDLWGSDGRVVAVDWASTSGATIESTLQTTRGNSGGPLYGDFNGQNHLVIGMVQGLRGNGIDVSEASPNVQLLFTSGMLSKIRAAQATNPCSR
jgi:V8-like Glu-specific endopeptidase